jgi:hypothetical protein
MKMFSPALFFVLRPAAWQTSFHDISRHLGVDGWRFMQQLEFSSCSCVVTHLKAGSCAKKRIQFQTEKKGGKNIHSQPARTKKYRIHTDWTPQARNFI